MRDDVDGISQDTLIGCAAMAAYTGLDERKVHYLASKGQLPGAFRIGKSWAMLKSSYAAELRARASRATAQASA